MIKFVFKRLPLIAAAGAGYVLGAKAGRERYEQIERTFTKVKEDPRVQEKTQQAADLAREKAPIVKDAVAGTASNAAGKVSDRMPGSSGDSAPEGELNPDSLVYQEDPYPKGDLP